MDYSQSELDHLTRMWYKLQANEAKQTAAKKAGLTVTQALGCLVLGRWSAFFR